MRWIMALGIAMALGISAAASDVGAGGAEQTAAGRALSSTLNAGWIWAGLAVLAGWLVSRAWRPSAAALAGMLALLMAVVSYYAYGVLWGDRAASGLGALSGTVRLWGMAAVVAGPLLGVAGSLGRRTGWWKLAAAAVVPVGAMAEILVIRRLNAETFRVDPWMAAAQACVLALAVAALAVSIWRWFSGRRAVS